MEERNILSGIVNSPYRQRGDIEEFIKREFLGNKEEYPEHQHLNYANLHVYGFETSNSKGYDRYGKIKYIRDDLIYTMTNGVDFVLLINEEIWDSAPDKQRLAIIDHFLHKIKAQYEWEDPETQKKIKGEFEDIPNDPGINLRHQTTKSGRFRWKIAKPVGEFPEVIRRHGGWNTEIKDMQNSFLTNE